MKIVASLYFSCSTQITGAAEKVNCIYICSSKPVPTYVKILTRVASLGAAVNALIRGICIKSGKLNAGQRGVLRDSCHGSRHSTVVTRTFDDLLVAGSTPPWLGLRVSKGRRL